VATVLGLTGVAAFGAAYAACARRVAWPAAVALAVLAFAGAALALRLLPTTLPLAAATTALALLAARRYVDARANPPAGAPSPGRDLAARVLTATALVAVLTAASGALGPEASGLLSPFPAVTGVMVAFAHRRCGAAAAVAVVRGVLGGLPAFAAFFVVVALAVEALGIPAGYAIAAAATALVGTLTLRGTRRRREPGSREPGEHQADEEPADRGVGDEDRGVARGEAVPVPVRQAREGRAGEPPDADE
jgi:hypothetical protein